MSALRHGGRNAEYPHFTTNVTQATICFPSAHLLSRMDSNSSGGPKNSGSIYSTFANHWAALGTDVRTICCLAWINIGHNCAPIYSHNSHRLLRHSARGRIHCLQVLALSSHSLQRAMRLFRHRAILGRSLKVLWGKCINCLSGLHFSKRLMDTFSYPSRTYFTSTAFRVALPTLLIILFLSTFAYKAIIVEAIAIGGDDGFELRSRK